MQRLHRNRPVEMQRFPDTYRNCRQQQQSSIFTDISKIREVKQVGKDKIKILSLIKLIKTGTLREQ